MEFFFYFHFFTESVCFFNRHYAKLKKYENSNPVNLFPRELLAEDYPPVILTQCDPKGHLHLKLVINFVPIHLHHLQTFSLELLNPFADIIPYYPFFPVFSMVSELFCAVQ